MPRTSLFALALALGVGACPVAAQVQPPDPATQARMAQTREAQALLASALSRLATNGRDPVALLDAGRASLALEDAKSAAGFLVRADEASPENPDVKAALGSAMLGLEDARSALSLFERARLLGASERVFLSDRGLAYDMIGDQRQAQRDYEMALAMAPSDETTRRYALSLGMSGQTERAVTVLVPLLKTQDRAAWRARAFILAMAGRTAEANDIVRATMPAELATNITPYLTRMNRLTPQQQAAAVHFGTFPPDSALGPPRLPVQIATAAVSPAPPPATVAADSGRKARRTEAKPVTRPVESPNAAAARPPRPQAPVDTRIATIVQPLPVPAAPAAPVTQPPAPASIPRTAPPAAAPAPTVIAQASPPRATVPVVVVESPPPVTSPASAPQAAPAPPMVVREVATVVDPPAAPSAPVVVAALPAAVPPPPAVPVPAARAEPSLADIAGSIAIPEAELATTRDALDIADLEQLRSEKRKAEAAEAAEAQRAAAAAKAKADADAKAKEAADVKRKHPARSWVQVATGANASALGGDFGRLARKYPDQFKGQSGGTAEWGRTRRLLVGPFKDAKAAQSWLNAYKKAGGDGFTWSSEAGQEVDKIGGR